MAIYGTIVRATGALASGTSTNEAKPYLARYANGQLIDTFATFQQAIKPIERSAGGRILNWISEPRSGIEAWRGEDP
jgi:hypothetical protein